MIQMPLSSPNPVAALAPTPGLRSPNPVIVTTMAL